MQAIQKIRAKRRFNLKESIIKAGLTIKIQKNSKIKIKIFAH